MKWELRSNSPGGGPPFRVCGTLMDCSRSGHGNRRTTFGYDSRRLPDPLKQLAIFEYGVTRAEINHAVMMVGQRVRPVALPGINTSVSNNPQSCRRLPHRLAHRKP